jgi:hypothetical protein
MTLPMLDRVERQEQRLDEMMKALGADALRLARREGGEAYARSRTLCLFCKSSNVCRQWLDSDNREAVPSFCPNLALLLECRRERQFEGDQG